MEIATYSRISQDKTGAGMAVENQLAAIKEWAEANGHTLGTAYTDNDLSATSGKVRPAFERLLRDNPPAVVVWHQDRLLRVSKDLERVLDAGMTIYSVVAGSLDLSTPQGRAVARTVTAWNTYEGEQKAARQKLRNSADAEAGKWHYARPVFGNDRVTGALIPDEAEAIRTAAADLVEDRTTFYQISKTWNAAGFRTPLSKGAGGKEWEPGTVRNFFTKPRLIGERVYKGETHTMEGWEPVLDRETFQSIQQLIEANRTGKRGVQGARNMPHLLTGIATCEKCGKGLNVQYRGGKGSAKAYRCTTPGHVSRVALPLEKWIVEKFLYLLLHEGADRIVHPEAADTSSKLRMERIALKREHEAWLDEAIDAGLSPAVIGKKETAHTKKLAELDARLLETLRETSFAMLIEEVPTAPQLMWERWETVPMDKKRAVIQSLFSSIVVRPGPQGARFKPEYVRLSPTPLMMQLVDLNS